MADQYTIQELIDRFGGSIDALQSVVNSLKTLRREEKDLPKGSVAMQDVVTTLRDAIEGSTGGIMARIADIAQALNAAASSYNDYALTIYPQIRLDLSYYDVDVDGGSATAPQATITAKDPSGTSTTFFNNIGWAAGDVIEIVGAKDANHNGLHTLSTSVAPTASILTFGSSFAGSDSIDNRMKLIWREDN